MDNDDDISDLDTQISSNLADITVLDTMICDNMISIAENS